MDIFSSHPAPPYVIFVAICLIPIYTTGAAAETSIPTWSAQLDAGWAEHERGYGIAVSADGGILYAGGLVFSGNTTYKVQQYSLKVTARSASDGSTLWTVVHAAAFHQSQELIVEVDPTTGSLAAIVTTASGQPWDNSIYLLSAVDGAVIWHVSSVTSLAISEARFVEDRLVVFHELNTWIGSSSPNHNVFTYSVATGQLIAKACGSPFDAYCTDDGRAAAIGVTRAVVSTTFGPYDHYGRVMAYDINTGARLWSRDLPRLLNESIIPSSVVLVGDLALVAARHHYYSGGGGSSLYALDATTGQVVWSRSPLVWEGSWPILVVNEGENSVYLGTRGLPGHAWLYAIDAISGDTQWRSRFLTPENPWANREGFRQLEVSSDGQNVLAIGNSLVGQDHRPWVLAGFRSDDGTLLWTENRTTWDYDPWRVFTQKSSLLRWSPTSNNYFVVSPGETTDGSDFVVEAYSYGGPSQAAPVVESSASRSLINLGQLVQHRAILEHDSAGQLLYRAWEWERGFSASSAPINFTYYTTGSYCVERRVISSTGQSAAAQTCANVTDDLKLDVTLNEDPLTRVKILDIAVDYGSGGAAVGAGVELDATYDSGDHDQNALWDLWGCRRFYGGDVVEADGRASIEISFTGRCVHSDISLFELPGQFSLWLHAEDAAGNRGDWRGNIAAS